MAELSASCLISSVRSLRPTRSALPSPPGASVSRSVISTWSLVLISPPKRPFRSRRSTVPPRIHRMVSTVRVGIGKPPSLISALDISSSCRCEAASRVKSTPSSSCSRSAFFSAHRNVVLPLSVGPSIATPDSLQSARYATWDSSLLDHGEWHCLRGHAQTEAGREALHVHRVIDRGNRVLAKLVPYPAPARRVAKRAESDPRHAEQPAEFRHPVHPAGARNDQAARVEPGWMRWPAARGHDHRPAARCCQPLAHERQGALELRGALVLPLVRLSADEPAQRVAPLIARRRPGPDLGR